MGARTYVYTVAVTQTSQPAIVCQEDLYGAVAEIAGRYETDRNRVETIEVTPRDPRTVAEQPACSAAAGPLDMPSASVEAAQPGIPERGLCCIYYARRDMDLIRDVIERRIVAYKAVRGTPAPSVGDLVFIGYGGPQVRVARGTWLTAGTLRLLVVGQIHAIEPGCLRLDEDLALCRDVGRELNPLARDLIAWSGSLAPAGTLCCETLGFAGRPSELLTRR